MGRSLSRELSHLAGSATEAWGRQREVLDAASSILADASRLAGRYTREEVAPRARHAYDDRVAPLLSTGLELGRSLLGKPAPQIVARKAGFGTFFLAGLGVAAVAAVAYVAWQTLRDDEGAWIDDDFDVD